MKNTLIILVLPLVVVTTALAQKDPKYFSQQPPELKPLVFSEGTISMPMQFEFGATYSKDRTEFFYGVEIDGKAETRYTKFEDGKWSTPVKLLVHDVYSYNDPFLSPDQQRLYFISDRSLTGQGEKKDYDIWYVQRKDGKWSDPVNAGNNINTTGNEYYMSFTKSGKMYFSSNGRTGSKNNYDIYSSEFRDGNFQPAVNAGTGVNTEHYEADVFVAPDESYLVFAANRPGGLGSGDLFVSFKQSDGQWSIARSLGSTINTKTDDFCPFVTPDGKYLFYASKGDVYWVSAQVIDQLR
jgi:Tol biopolymer transport system component